jgi:hypothetical protein
VNEQERPKGGGQPTEEELRAAMEEQLRQVRVQDVLLQTVATLVNLGGRRLGLAPESEDERDLEQARLAIEGTRALVPLLGPEEARAVRDALSQLQVAFARQAGAAPTEAGEQAPAGAGEATSQPPGGQGRPGDKQATPDDVERAKARAKIWTPGKS